MGCASSKEKDPEKERIKQEKKQEAKLEKERKKEEKKKEKEAKKNKKKNKEDGEAQVDAAAAPGAEPAGTGPQAPPSISSTAQGDSQPTEATTTMHNLHRVDATTPEAEPAQDHEAELSPEEHHVGGSAALTETDSVVSSKKQEPQPPTATSNPSSRNSKEQKGHKHHHNKKKSHDKKNKKKKHGHKKGAKEESDDSDDDDETSSSTGSEESTPKKSKSKEVNFVLSSGTPSATSAATPASIVSPAAAAANGGGGSPSANRRERDHSVSVEVEEVQELPARRTPVLVNSTSQTEDLTPTSQWMERTPVQRPPTAASNASSPSGTARAASSVNRRSAVPVPPELASLDYQNAATLFTPISKERQPRGGEDHTPYGGGGGSACRSGVAASARDDAYYSSYVNDAYARPSYTPYRQSEQTLPGSPYFQANQTSPLRDEPPLYYPPTREVAVYANPAPFGRTDEGAYVPYSPLYNSPPAAAAAIAPRATSEPRTFFYSLPSQLPNENYYDNVPAQRIPAAAPAPASAAVPPSMTYFASAGRDEGPRYAAPPVEQEVMWPTSPSPAPPARARYQADVEEEDPFPCVYGRVYARSPPGPTATVQTLDPIVPSGHYIDPMERREYVENGPVFATRNTYFQSYEARQQQQQQQLLHDDSMWSSREGGGQGHSRGYLSEMW